MSAKTQSGTLSEKRELYRLLINNALDGLLICDTRGNYLYASPSMERLSGYRTDEFIKYSVFDFCHPDDIIANKEHLQLLTEGKAASFEARFRKKNGQYIWAEVSARPVQTSSGDIKIIVVNRDITERKNLQEEVRKFSENLEQLVIERSALLSKKKEYLQELINHLPLALIAWDKEFKIRTCNPKATDTFGFSEPECLKKGLTALFPSNNGAVILGGIWDQLQKGKAANSIEENLNRHGEKILCRWTNTPLKASNGNLTAVLSMIQDITEKRALEERLKEITYSLSGIKAGESYLVSNLQSCLKIAFDIIGHGIEGLFFVRENPDSLVANYNFKHEEIMLLSMRSLNGFKAINELQDVAIEITKFLENGGGLVILGGLEYLISRHGFNAVFLMLQEKRFEFLESRATLLVPVNLDTLDAKEKGLLGGELKTIN